MTKQTEALRMAIEVFDMYGNKMNSAFADEAYQACKEALEPTVAELNDEYLRDTHVEGMPKDGNCCTEGCIKCDARKVLAETQKPILIQWYDEEEDVWENTDERHYQHYADTGHKIRFLYTTPSREWQSLSDEEIDAIFPLGDDVDVIDVARGIEAKLREKNNGLNVG